MRFAGVGIGVMATVLLAGCATSKIAYKPSGVAAPAAAKSVALTVVDARPADKGGSDKAQVGQVRGQYGIPGAVKDSNIAVVQKTVTEATEDSLRQAGIGVQAGGNRTLVAKVKHFWMDGFQGYKGTVVVSYSLQDAAGKELWAKEISGGSGGALLFKSGESLANEVFGKALTDLATKAVTEFKSADFQRNL